ncbi:RNA pyrophosphohydrolase [Kordiimonas lipolytica]|uniref:RNA pyrophosphohydrolase n=1 Tax=Kordiimonas lipolytica TaxID=1662421 RepID=A0ABV8UEU6_9PROT|nr:RNA pyrophosphohydrolase [Kordiimonas lipolytica]
MTTDLPYRPCVGIMLVNANGLVFTGERIDTPGAWQMPQGGIDAGEAPEVAALRELEEEIGVAPDQVKLVRQTEDWVTYDLPPHLLGKAWGGKYRGQKQCWFLMELTAGDDAINIETAHPEFSAWKWTTPDMLVEEIVPFKRTVYTEVVKQLLG